MTWDLIKLLVDEFNSRLAEDVRLKIYKCGNI